LLCEAGLSIGEVGRLRFILVNGALVGGRAAELLMIGKAMPRNLPLLAMPTPQVRVVSYPEQSFPTSRH